VITDDAEKAAAIFRHYTGKQPDKVEINESNVRILYKDSIDKHVADAIADDIDKYVRKGFKVEITSS
ncbi:MAG: hypothetical protein QXK90_03975, partial [Candidatus Parvarchaeota archaeon]